MKEKTQGFTKSRNATCQKQVEFVSLYYISVKFEGIWSDVVLSTTAHFLLRYMKPKKEDKINNRAK